MGLVSMRTALTDPEIDVEDKDLIRYRLLPRCLSHVKDLDRMIEAVKK